MEELHCIRVTGKGQMKLRPDTTRIIMTLSGVYPDYSDALAHAAAEPELSIGYTVSDPEAAKAQLLERAVEDAKNKAAVLAKAAGVTLLHIQTIDYAWQNTDLSVYPMQRNLLCKAEASADTFDLGIEPDDIEASDTVTVVFTIS